MKLPDDDTYKVSRLHFSTCLRRAALPKLTNFLHSWNYQLDASLRIEQQRIHSFVIECRCLFWIQTRQLNRMSSSDSTAWTRSESI
jgi:hypothetical protein